MVRYERDDTDSRKDGRPMLEERERVFQLSGFSGSAKKKNKQLLESIGCRVIESGPLQHPLTLPFCCASAGYPV